MRRVVPFCLVLAWPALGAELPVRSVTLSNAGLMQLERGGPLEAGESVTFRAPTEDVDDVLKSLVVRDAAGTLEGLRLPAQDLEAEAFRGLPLRPADFETRVALLKALRGHLVEAGGAQGRLADAEETEPGLRLALLTEAGLRSVVLRAGEEVRLLDQALAGRLRRAAEALAAARTGDERVVEIRLRGTAGRREVGFTYVAAAPLWKPSWRLVVPEAGGEARLQGWAVVENRSGADWEGVRLSLVSGNPAAFHQPLYAPIRVERPELPVGVAELVTVLADTGAGPPPPAPAPAMLAMAMPPPAAAPMMRSAAGAGAAERFQQDIAAAPAALAVSSAGRVAFTLPAPVTIRTGETANLPFFDAALPAERVWWVQDLGARNPLNAVRLRNAGTAVLPDGLATVYGGGGAEAGAFLGDAELRAVAPGEQRLVAFARDRDVQLSSAGGSSEVPVGIRLRPGVVVVATLRREETALAVDSRGAKGRLVLDLPRRAGMTPRFTLAGEGDFGLRTEAMLDGTATTLRFAWDRQGETELPLWDAGLGDPMLLRWREANVEQNLRRLPGGPGTLETLATILERLPAEAPGRARLAALVPALGQARALLEAARTAIRQYGTADAALARARAAADDRSGAAKEQARQALNRASQEAERAGAAADAAWEAWQRAVQALRAMG
jgi:hypothetical protein